MAAKEKEKIIDQEAEFEAENIEKGSIADGLYTLAMAAKLSGNWLRVFDIRYATAGNPSKITKDFILFPPGSVEVLETGNLNEAAASVEELSFPRAVACQAIIQYEICKPNANKRR